MGPWRRSSRWSSITRRSARRSNTPPTTPWRSLGPREAEEDGSSRSGQPRPSASNKDGSSSPASRGALTARVTLGMGSRLRPPWGLSKTSSYLLEHSGTTPAGPISANLGRVCLSVGRPPARTVLAANEWRWFVPRIPRLLLDSVIYLHPSEAEARNGDRVGGSGFLVGVGAAGSPATTRRERGARRSSRRSGRRPSKPLAATGPDRLPCGHGRLHDLRRDEPRW